MREVAFFLGAVRIEKLRTIDDGFSVAICLVAPRIGVVAA